MGIMERKKIAVIIPAYNEAAAIGKVVMGVPRDWVAEVIVVDNGSSDETAAVAAAAGATVLEERERGYGAACLRGIGYLAGRGVEVVVFMDGDFSDYGEQLPMVAGPVVAGEVDMVIGSRVLGKAERGALMPQQRFGNWLATRLLRWFYGVRYTDLGPFRAIGYGALVGLEMEDRNYGWTVEMQIKAAKKGLRYKEVGVDYRCRIGESKVSGTLKGSIMAGYKIIRTLFKYR